MAALRADPVAGVRPTRFRLTEAAVPGTIKVEVDDRLVPAQVSGRPQWTYAEEIAAIEFTPEAAPAHGATVRIRYDVGCPR